MTKIPKPRSFSDIVSTLGTQQFDVSPALEGAGGVGGAFRVQKHGCAAEIARAADGSVELTSRPGWLLGGEISRLLDRGYQKFLRTSKLEIPATATHLRALHEFSEELKEATGAGSLYNESLGTTSDRYQYDRVQGRK